MLSESLLAPLDFLFPIFAFAWPAFSNVCFFQSSKDRNEASLSSPLNISVGDSSVASVSVAVGGRLKVVEALLFKVSLSWLSPPEVCVVFDPSEPGIIVPPDWPSPATVTSPMVSDTEDVAFELLHDDFKHCWGSESVI